MKSGVCQPGICGFPPAGLLNIHGLSHTPPKVSARVSLAFDPRRHFGTRAPGRVESALEEVGGSLGGVGGRLFTDKLGFGWSEVLGDWSLDSATPATSAYSAHTSGSPKLESPRTQ